MNQKRIINRNRRFNSMWPGAKFWKGSKTTPLSPHITYPAKFDEIDGQSITPLTMAAMSGNTLYVKSLLSSYPLDLEIECNIVFDGLVMYGATALWVSAGLGHLEVVKLLVYNGANINHNTKPQSSPLRAACYTGRLDIVQYLIEHGADVNLSNKYNNTCLMIAAYKGHANVVDTLLKNGANPNVQALCGSTALHYAAECGHMEVCRILLNYGAKLLENEHGLTPILNAAERTHEDIVNLFIETPNLLTTEDVIMALELMGASFANDKDNYDIEKSYTYLMQAMEMRYSDSKQIIRKQLIPPVSAYDDWFETENLTDLQSIRYNYHCLHMESLTIRERILGKHNPDLPQSIVYRGAIMADQGRFSQCQILWNYAMDLRMMNNISIQADLLRFTQFFSQILRMENIRLDLSQVLSVLVKCQQEIERNKCKIINPGPKDIPEMIVDQNQQNVICALYLIKIITNILMQQSQFNKEHLDLLKNTLRKFIKCDTRLFGGQTLLHMAVNGVLPMDDFYNSDVCKFPCYRTALLLVHAGASVIATDELCNTPLHTLVASYPQNNPQLLVQAEQIIKLLVDAGAHLDAINAQDLTPAQVDHIGGLRNIILGYENSLTSLKCIASRCIANNKIRYKGLVPKVLESYIQIHSAEKHY
ncbi:protein fem-1 homolog B-like [Cochliomyia hominivorax]